MDIYFLSNQSDTPEDITPAFRVNGRAPELWHPDTGQIERMAVYSITPNAERVPIHLAGRGSVFVVFRSAADVNPITSITRNGETVVSLASSTVSNSFPLATDGSTKLPMELTRSSKDTVTALAWHSGEYEFNDANGRSRTLDVEFVPPPLKIGGPWTMQLPPSNGIESPVSFDLLESWTERKEPAIKYFSGTVVYRKRFDIPADRFGKTQRLYLNLGQVEDLVEVILNGKDLGTLWKEPFCLDITQAARPDSNDLELHIVNVWHNRLVGQKLHPAAFGAHGEFIPWASYVPEYPAREPLYASGLLGPVTLQSAIQLQAPEL